MALKTDNGTLPYCRAVGYVPIKAWRDRGASSLERATKTTVLLEALLDGKAEALTKKAIEMPCSKSEGKNPFHLLALVKSIEVLEGH